MKTIDPAVTKALIPELSFLEDVQQCIDSNHGECIDCIISWCEEKSIEMEQVIPLIKANKVLKNALMLEAAEKNHLKKQKKKKGKR